jgi:hypothetical protein
MVEQPREGVQVALLAAGYPFAVDRVGHIYFRLVLQRDFYQWDTDFHR